MRRGKMVSIFQYLGVLVIERDPLFRLVAEEMLQECGFRAIYSEANPDHLAEIMKAMQVDLALIDQDYSQALTKIRTHQTSHHILLISMAMDMGPTNYIRAVRAGADAIIPKNFSRKLLLDTITRIMSSENGRRARIVPFPERIRRNAP